VGSSPGASASAESIAGEVAVRVKVSMAWGLGLVAPFHRIWGSASRSWLPWPVAVVSAAGVL
jgi:hypothetical protein